MYIYPSYFLMYLETLDLKILLPKFNFTHPVILKAGSADIFSMRGKIKST